MEDSQIIATANAILSQLTVPRRVKTIEDLNADLFVTLYEGLCGDSIPDLILPTSKEEDEVHNMQCVIDSLAMDILHTSLAHIVGQDVVNGRRMSLINLLDIFSGLLEYILDGIEKEEVNSSAEGSENTDTINQSAISDALRKGLKDTTNQQQSANVEVAGARGSPTASPSSKKSRHSEERRRGKKATPNAVSQPIASSSMQSIHPSCTESESDASTKPSAGRALSFSKVPAEFSPKATSLPAPANDTTFVKPRVPPEQTIAQKLADEILATGESTSELIALGDTPVTRARTRSATRKQAAESRRKYLHADKLSDSESNGRLHEGSGADRKSKGTKRSRHPKRHVSFVSDRTLPSDDTLADVPTHLEYPRRVASDPTHVRVGSPSSAPVDLDLSARLVDYFEGKETRQAWTADKSPLAEFGAGDRSPITQSSEYQTAMEKSASLYERVKALRNAANEKLESLRSDSVSEDYRTAGAAHPSSTEYYMPTTSGGTKQLNRGSSVDSISQTATSRYQTACADIRVTSAPPPTLAENLAEGDGVSTGYRTTRLQTNAPDIAALTSSSAGVAIPLSHKSTTAPSQQSNSLPFHTITQASESTAYRTGRDPITDTYLTGHDLKTDTYLTGRDPKTDTCVTGRDPKTDTHLTGRDPKTDTCVTGRDPTTNRSAGASIKKTLLDEGYSGLSVTRPGRSGEFELSSSVPYLRGNKATAPLSQLDEEEETGTSSLRFTVDRRRDTNSKGVSDSSRPNWRPKNSLLESRNKKVRFTRSFSADQKSKSQTMVDAVRKTLDEEKWRERMQEKLLTRQYREDLSDMVEAHRHQIEEEKAAATQQDKQFTTNIHRLAQAYNDQPQRRVKPPSNPKGYLLPKSRVVKKKPLRKSASKTVDSKPVKSLDPDDEDFLPNLMDEFPHLYLVPETIQKMWTNHQKQSASVSRSMEEEKRKKSKAKATIEDAEKRQALLMNIMQKELDHTKRMKQLRDKENSEIESKRKQRDVRVQSARVKQYYDEYATRMKASMLKNKTKEEQLFKRLFAEGLKVQKERMQALRGYAREQRERRAHKQAVDVESLENFYKDQFNMLAESVSQERKNVEVRDNAQAQVLNNMKAELRKKMEADIKNFQEQLKCDDDDYYFRQLDAEKAVQKLNMARFQTGL